MTQKIDRNWFINQQRNLGFSQTEFARRLGLDKASWSRTLSGERRMKDEEKIKAAKVIGVPLHELLARVGMPVDARSAGPGTATAIRASATSASARLAGTVDAATGLVAFEPGGLALPVVELTVVGDSWLAGWVVTCEPSAVAATPAAEHEAGIVQLRDGRMLLRKVRPGFSPGLFDLGPFLGFGAQENGAEIVGVIPVVGIRRG